MNDRRSLMARLRACFDGRVIGPDDPAYDEARAVFLRGIDRRPAAIVRATSPGDVARVVSLAAETGFELAVRSAGHSAAGYGTSEGGIVLDLSRMRSLEIDVERATAWAGTGLTAGEYTTKAGVHGLTTGFGDTASVGIGGITLGGGIGFLVRKHGLTIDDLLAAELVCADGRLRRVDGETHPELFWAIRGGGGNFGIATRFKFRLHRIDQILGGMLVLPATPEVIAGLVAEAQAAPEDLSTILNVMPAPPMPFLPAGLHGRTVVIGLFAYAGPVEAGERAMAPFRTLATPHADMIRPMRYPELYEMTAGGPHPVAAAGHSMFLDGFDRASAESVVGWLEESKAPMRVAQLRVLGGAVARVPIDATAFAHRTRSILVTVAALYERLEEAAIHRSWVEDFATALRPAPGVYVGFLGDEGPARVRAAYPGDTWDRLRAIKRRHDPANLFRLNQNIPPAAVPEEVTP